MPLTVAIGFDPRESIAFYVLAHSIMRRASGPIQIIPLALPNLKPIHNRPRAIHQSTDFTFTRFLTPSLADFNQVSVFLDCDMLCLGDIYELKAYADNQKYADVLVVKHDYTPVDETKFLGNKQTSYPCKNWSSVMVFNGHRMACQRLTRDAVNTMSAMDLHQFKWADEVGTLPAEWNYLVGENDILPAPPKLIHWTNGGPWFKNYLNAEHADLWFDEMRDMLRRDNPSFELHREPL
jgi:lipopolysaccharide biosynthesis glycosyltransferase